MNLKKIKGKKRKKRIYFKVLASSAAVIFWVVDNQTSPNPSMAMKFMMKFWGGMQPSGA